MSTDIPTHDPKDNGNEAPHTEQRHVSENSHVHERIRRADLLTEQKSRSARTIRKLRLVPPGVPRDVHSKMTQQKMLAGSQRDSYMRTLGNTSTSEASCVVDATEGLKHEVRGKGSHKTQSHTRTLTVALLHRSVRVVPRAKNRRKISVC